MKDHLACEEGPGPGHGPSQEDSGTKRNCLRIRILRSLLRVSPQMGVCLGQVWAWGR